MRWWLITSAVVVASCAKGGVELVITPGDARVKQVHLFVGIGDEYTQPIKTARRALPFPKSTAWARDAYNELDVRAVVDGEPVEFQFQGGGKLGVVIAIGVDGDTAVTAAVAHHLVIPSDIIARYELELEPVNTAASPLELDAWTPAPGSPKADKVCVALFDNRTTSADAVVTDGDPDCDGWPTDDPKECQPNLYMSYKRPTLEDVACVLNEMTPDSAVSTCVLGGPACADGRGKELACNAPSRYCTMRSVCERCKQIGNSTLDCARDVTPLVSGGLPTHINCKIYFDSNGSLCTNKMKAFASPPANVGGHFCRTGTTNPPRITTAGGAWTQDVTWTEGGGTFAIHVDNLEASCNFDIAPSGSGIVRNVYGAMVAGLLDNGRGIAIPIVFDVDALNVGCQNQTACAAAWSWDISELVDTCVNNPVFPP
jgi:hypothetical protein